MTIEREGRDPQRFWLSVLDALRGTEEGSSIIRPLTAAPDLDAWEIVEALLEDLDTLDEPLWLVIDDVHELRTSDALRQLELLLLRAPRRLRFVLATRHDLRLGLHRLRLEGGLTEIRGDALRFSLAEAGAMFAVSGIQLSDRALTLLHQRTEGWAAGLRLAALSLVDHPDPERFAAEFSGSERTVADYLLAEVLDRQPDDVRRLVLRTSVLERVNGELADLLTEGTGGERILRQLESANAFVVSIDASRTWFRYHQLFADLLRTELRSSEPDVVPVLHSKASQWLVEHGWPAEAVRHAQAAGEWSAAARMLADAWLGLQLGGNGEVARELLSAFPAALMSDDAELIAMRAADGFAAGTLEEAEQQLAVAEARTEAVPVDRRDQFCVGVAILRLELARERGDIAAVVEQAQQLLFPADTTAEAQLHVRAEYRAMVLVSLGIAELWMLWIPDAEAHLERGIALARSVEQPYLEVLGLSHWAFAASVRDYDEAYERATQAIELARQNGWGEESAVTMAYMTLVTSMTSQGRLEEATDWLNHADRSAGTDPQGVTGLLLYFARGSNEYAIGRLEDAAATFARGMRVAEHVVPGHPVARRMQSFHLQVLVQLGATEEVERAIAAMSEEERAGGETCITLATLRLATGDPERAAEALAPLRGTDFGPHPLYAVHVLLLEAIARDRLGETTAAGDALEGALRLAEADGTVLPFLHHPAPDLLARHRRRGTAHPALLAEILDLLGGQQRTPADGRRPSLPEPLTERELLVLRYLPTNLSLREIADELYVALSTVKTHTNHLYTKLDAHSRREAVDTARELGLLASQLRRS